MWTAISSSVLHHSLTLLKWATKPRQVISESCVFHQSSASSHKFVKVLMY
jgi:hypothetical protein